MSDESLVEEGALAPVTRPGDRTADLSPGLVTGLDGPPRPTRYAAVLWDMDGTVVDTEPYWMQCEAEMAEK
jgi:hypothetical protein